MILYIKNMVCQRCKMVVKHELKNLGFFCISAEIGWAEIDGVFSIEQMDSFKIALLQSGLELIDDKKNILIGKIKNVVAEMLDSSYCRLKTNFSDYLSAKLGLDYTYLANIFSEQEGITLEHFIIANKILRVKQLIRFDELNLTEISWKLNYSSVAHLSTQFKKITGITPSRFKYIECNGQLHAEMCEL